VAESYGAGSYVWHKKTDSDISLNPLILLLEVKKSKIKPGLSTVVAVGALWFRKKATFRESKTHAWSGDDSFSF